MTFSHLSKQLIRNIRKRMARIVVPKLGHVKIRYHRPLPHGKIKNLTIQRKASGWYANIAVQVPDTPEVEVQTTIGIDVGLESFLTTSDGEKVHNHRYFRTSERKLSKAQRVLSRREKGSTRYQTQREHVVKIHQHIANQRRDFHYKTAHRLFVLCDEVAIEDLKISNMVQNHYLSKSISDAGWGNFQLTLQNKVVNTGKQLTPSTRLRNVSGCGLILDRDHNAAINIKKAAVALRGGVVVVSTPEKTRQRKEAQNPINPRFGLQAPPL